MAESRHFKNCFIAISQLGFGARTQNCWFEERSRVKVSKFCKFKMADGRHIENRY